MSVEEKNLNATPEGQGDNLEGPKKPEEPKEEVLNLSKGEYEKQIQAESDKRVSQALKTAKSKWEHEYKEKLDKERADAERLAKLSAEEREKELLDRSRSELTEKEKILRKRELKLAAIDILTEEKLPVSFADQLLGEDADETHDRIKKFKKAWTDAIEEEVNKRLKGVVPKAGSDSKNKPADMNSIIRSMAKR